MRKKSETESFTRESTKSAGDNTPSREQINSKATDNEDEYVKALVQVSKDRAAE